MTLLSRFQWDWILFNCRPLNGNWKIITLCALCALSDLSGRSSQSEAWSGRWNECSHLSAKQSGTISIAEGLIGLIKTIGKVMFRVDGPHGVHLQDGAALSAWDVFSFISVSGSGSPYFPISWRIAAFSGVRTILLLFLGPRLPYCSGW